MFLALVAGVLLACATAPPDADPRAPGLFVSWNDEVLTVHGERLPGGAVQVWYIEAFCRPNSTDCAWNETVIGHDTQLVAASADGSRLELRSTLDDGVLVDHTITAGGDEVDFQVAAHNPTDRRSDAHWAQPCIRVDAFTGRTQDDYLDKVFVFVDGTLERLPTEPWATAARYVPGQVWCPAGVPRTDVNPRPLSAIVPSNGLIGCFSQDENTILATAWQPYQELFQGVIVCLHSDFRIGGLDPGETNTIRGKIYVVDADVPRLLERYARDFPEHARGR